MKFLTQFILLGALCSSLHAAIDPYKKNVLTTNDVTLGPSMSLAGGVLDVTSSSASLQTFYYGGQFGFSSSSIIPTNVHSGILAAGLSDLFTVPAGKRFYATAAVLGTTNLTTGTAYSLLKTNGVYYRFSANATNVRTNTPNALGLANSNGSGFLFEEGETVAITNTLSGGNFVLSGLLFSTNVAIKSPRLLSMSGGNDVLYTCPADKCALNMSLNNPGNLSLLIQYVNDSGAARIVDIYIVPSGGTADSSNRQFRGSLASPSITPFVVPIMFPGDSIVVASDAVTAIQWVSTTVAEIPFP